MQPNVYVYHWYERMPSSHTMAIKLSPAHGSVLAQHRLCVPLRCAALHTHTFPAPLPLQPGDNTDVKDGHHSSVKAGLAGLALSYAPGLTDTLNFMLRQVRLPTARLSNLSALTVMIHGARST